MFSQYKAKIGTGSAVATLSLLFLPVAACAQNWSYNPYTGSANWLGVANTLMYPLNRLSRAGAPFYLANPLIWNASYAVNQSVTNKNRQFNYGNYNDQEPYNDPRQRTRPLVSDGNQVTDQIVHAKRMPGTQPFAPAGWQPPDAPAQSFIDTVNGKYNGDISKALFDPQTRSMARSIGLVSDDSVFDADLSADKVQTIKGILADSKEDPQVRINAVHMLLKH